MWTTIENPSAPAPASKSAVKDAEIEKGRDVLSVVGDQSAPTCAFCPVAKFCVRMPQCPALPSAV